jgi:hypothetical protein
MKRVLIFVIFVFAISFCKAGISNPSFQETSGNEIRLSHDQYMVTYAGASNNDIVGVFDPWYPTADTTSGTFSFTFINNNSGAYAINSSTGVITINDNTKLSSGNTTLVVRTSLRGRTQDNNVYVTVKATADCYFIDPSAGSYGNGTRNSPFNGWWDFTIQAGKAYFQKRGTLSKTPFGFVASGSKGNEIIFGSYGTGSRAEISAGITNIGIDFAGSYVQFYELYFYDNLFGIETETGSSPYQHCLFSDLTFESNGANGQLYIKRHGDRGNNYFYHEIYDIVAFNGGDHGVKSEGGASIFENIRAYGNKLHGVSLPNWGAYNKLSGLSTHDNGTSGIELSGQYQDLSYSYFKNEYRGIVEDDPYSWGSVIHHCLINGTSGMGISLRGSDVSISLAKNFIIEDNEIKNSTTQGMAAIAIGFATKNVVIRRNYIHNSYNGIDIGESNVSVDSVAINCNILVANNNLDIVGNAGSRIWILNNTMSGNVNLGGTSSEVVKNNFLRTLNSANNSSNNLDISTIKTADYFVNYNANNFALKSSAVKAIDQGINVGLNADYNLNPVVNLPDIGAFEFSAPPTPPPVDTTTPPPPPPVVGKVPSAPTELVSKEFTDNSITIKWNDNSSNENSFLIKRALALDPEKIVTITVHANDTSFVDHDLTPNTTYLYLVQAINQAGPSNASNKNVASTLSVAETKRIKDGLIAYYNFGYDIYSTVRDLSGYGEPLNLKITQPTAVTWNEWNRMQINSGTALVSMVPATKIVKAIKRTKELTVETWIRPYEPFSSADSRILSIGNNDADVGFVLEQYYNASNDKSMNYGSRLRTQSTNNAGFPELLPEKSGSYINMQHIAYVRDTLGNEALYLNGSKVADGYRPNNLDNWNDNYYLRFGNEADLNHPWKGTVYVAAIYNKALSYSEIINNYRAGPCDSLQTDGMNYQINVYPNPAVDKTTIEITPNGALDFIPSTYIRLQDMSGRIYYQESIFNPNNSYTKVLNLDRLVKGVYFIQVISGKKYKTAKLIVQ